MPRLAPKWSTKGAHIYYWHDKTGSLHLNSVFSCIEKCLTVLSNCRFQINSAWPITTWKTTETLAIPDLSPFHLPFPTNFFTSYISQSQDRSENVSQSHDRTPANRVGRLLYSLNVASRVEALSTVKYPPTPAILILVIELSKEAYQLERGEVKVRGRGGRQLSSHHYFSNM